ncbi:MAG: Alkyl hydroperoxide reductase subunit F (Alkyl hydroperoxide reductase F52A protein) [Parcubacteria group bacterium GW2011_GWA2_43_13]|nr:MAG: Alkyl hydroperoxide reductase subunit F (Alkyl hydroperoxide reductase F52A protein) [Parcubacteria group bacterium GW2011_GWA2_43_13]OGY70726.1 MAG: hypothetical protein A2986_03070 [Candidatus Jacksonbacteria bacterium RIFCSPLOWO2_01_FULL_44_13]HAZ16679.1 hypothetical protein [Candidatus Jacksonbacteria bacterium]
MELFFDAMNYDFDVVIIGAGGAGMAAAIYTTRYDLKTVIFTKDIGGQAATTEVIENYPGFESVGGMELMQKFQKHAEKTGTEFRYEWVKQVSNIKFQISNNTSPQPSPMLGEGDDDGVASSLNPSSPDTGSGQVRRGDDGDSPLGAGVGGVSGFKITTDAGEYTAKVVILASGMKHKHLNVPGEERFEGHGVAYCATCDAPFYKNKVAAVVGGGNSALEAVEFLSRVATKVYGIVWDKEYQGEPALIKTVMASDKVEKIYNAETLEIKGDTKVKGLVYKNRTTGEQKEIALDGVFIEIGWQADTEWLGDLVETNKWGEIIVTEKAETKTPGLYAAGDLTNIFTKQLVASAGQGCLAAVRAIQFIREGK